MITDVASWLETSGLSPSELADELGLPRSQISRLIAGEEPVDKVIGWALVGLGTRKRAGAVPPNPPRPITSLSDDLADDTWTGKTARLAMPILAEIAQGKPTTITYKDLHQKIVERGGKEDIGSLTKYAFPLGRIATAVENIGDGIPPLTAIVVRGSTGLPSDGIDPFIKGYLGLHGLEARKLKSPEGRRAIVQRLWDDVFAYNKWPSVVSRLGLTGDPNYDL
ncbi:helix-turn-helix transcriptional regulator [Microvirga sp. HBU67558]|uniref:helix-turn-helix transcriptional regulator n=1 Tax=Microvirga sp. HBU67558 TaxID=2824562 RepID=UPI001B385CA5|nr:helix-turn-helix transcriptional regulator [Microvirga sp. HBU67558]MBQ0820718.1 helix-turn-helix transcriptional regulator [Microvirga sp. HBU67558]